MEELVKYLKALVMLQANQQAGGNPVKPELLLHKAGFRAKEIGEIVGKNEAAVRKAVSRNRISGKDTDGE
jgi:hypothetical protein